MLGIALDTSAGSMRVAIDARAAASQPFEDCADVGSSARPELKSVCIMYMLERTLEGPGG